MEERYAIARVDRSGYSNIVVGDGFPSAGEAHQAAVDYYRHTQVECYAVRLVPIHLDKKPSLQVVREQTGAIASQVTSIMTRTEQIYQELHQMRDSIAGVSS